MVAACEWARALFTVNRCTQAELQQLVSLGPKRQDSLLNCAKLCRSKLGGGMATLIGPVAASVCLMLALSAATLQHRAQ